MLLFGDCDGGLQGPRWPIHSLLPHLRWVGKKWFIWQFWETITGQGIKAGFRSKFCCLGALMGVPRVPDDNYMALCHRQGGLRIKMFHLTVYPLGKKHASRVNVVVWGFCWGAPGSQMANTRPLARGEVGWKKNGPFGRENYWSHPSCKAAMENRLVLGVNVVVWDLWWGSPAPRRPIDGPLPQVRWVKKRNLVALREIY